MPQPLQLACPIMRRAANPQPDPSAPTCQKTPVTCRRRSFRRSTGCSATINTMQHENTLGRVHANADKLVHGRLPCMRSANAMLALVPSGPGRTTGQRDGLGCIPMMRFANSLAGSTQVGFT